MARASTGIFRWRRRRGKAARLRPVCEDAVSTTWLFDANGHSRRNGTTPPGPDTVDTSAGHEPNGSAPLVRYEWRSAGGETLVVEAGWPVAEGGAEPEMTVRQEGGPQLGTPEPSPRAPTALERAGFERPRFKAPARSGRPPTIDLRN